MNQQEFDDWTKVTALSTRKWTVDETTLANRGEYLIYKGGESGHYFLVGEDGSVRFGTYEYAIPHIGEAIFKTTGVKQFLSQDKALTRLIEVAGLSFLMDFIGVR